MEEQTVKKTKNTDKNVKIGKTSKVRRSGKFRLIFILTLMAIVAILFIFFEKLRLLLVGVFIILLAALGLEVSGNDFDLGKLIQTGSLEESRVEKSDGRWLIDDERCQAEDFNCTNFEYQEDAQDLFEYCGGPGSDIHGLDGDKDGIVCEALPSKN